MTRWIAGIATLLLLLTVAVIALVNAQGVPIPELERRCRDSAPVWNNYQEDIKGQIGAKPVAEWHGSPVWAILEGRELGVAFDLTAPWSEYPCALPILLRDPLGNEYKSVQTDLSDGLRVYRFTLAEGAIVGLPWVEIHYPHQQRRLALDETGRWVGSSR